MTTQSDDGEEDDARRSDDARRHPMPPHFTFKKWLCSSVDIAIILLFLALALTTAQEILSSQNSKATPSSSKQESRTPFVDFLKSPICLLLFYTLGALLFTLFLYGFHARSPALITVHIFAWALALPASFISIFKEDGDAQTPWFWATLTVVSIVTIITSWSYFIELRPAFLADEEEREIKGRRRAADENGDCNKV